MKTGIEKFKDVIDSDICDLVIKHIEDNIDQLENMEYGDNQNVICKESILEQGCELDSLIYKVVNKVILMYKEKYFWFNATGDRGYQVRKITGATREHIDFSSKPTDSRIISIIFGLNSDYEKGEFYFPYQDFSTTVKRGEAIAFPVYFMYPHFVNEPIGYRYTINTWVENVRDA